LVVGNQPAPVVAGNFDVDIAFGYEKIELSVADTDGNVQAVLGQIKSKYSALLRNKTLDNI